MLACSVVTFRRARAVPPRFHAGATLGFARAKYPIVLGNGPDLFE